MSEYQPSKFPLDAPQTSAFRLDSQLRVFNPLLTFFDRSPGSGCGNRTVPPADLASLRSSGADPPSPPAVCGGSPHPQHLPHAGGRHQLLSASEQQNQNRVQGQRPAGIHRVQGEHHRGAPFHRRQDAAHRCSWQAGALLQVSVGRSVPFHPSLCLLHTQACSSWCAWLC